MSVEWTWNDGDYAIMAGRISTDEQTQKSLPDQDSSAEVVAAKIGLSIPEDGYYHDMISRDLWPHPGLERAFERMVDPHCRVLIVTATDRIMTGPLQQAEVFDVLAENGVMLLDESVSHKNKDTEFDEAMAGIEAVMARLEVRRTRRRAYSSASQKARHSIFISKPPYGVQATDEERVWQLVPEEVENLRRMFEWAARGSTPAEIEKLCQVMGIGSTRKVYKTGTRIGQEYGGDTWSASNIRKMLKNEFYKGVYIWNRYQTKRRPRTNVKYRELRPQSEWIVGEHTLGAIIPVELFEEANRQIGLRHKTKSESRKYDPMVFDGMVHCGRCGWKMYPRKRSKKLADGSSSNLFDYRCEGVYQKYSTCTRNHVLPESWLFDAVAGVSPAARASVVVSRSMHHDEVAESVELQQIGKRLLDLDEQAERVFTMAVRSSTYTPERVDAEIARIDAERGQVLARQAEIQAAPKFQPLSRTLIDLWDRGVALLRDDSIPIAERQRWVRTHIERIVVDRPRVDVIARSVPDGFELQ